ncbi:hypothetical protein ABPG72_002917 [Tetrahymena utriculariae]
MNQSLQEISQADINQKQNIESNYQFSQMFKNYFQRTSRKTDLDSKLEDPKQQFSTSKNLYLDQNDLILSPNQLKSINQLQSINKNNNNNSLSGTLNNLLQSPSQETSKTNQNNLNTSIEQYKYNNNSFNFLNSTQHKNKFSQKHKKQILGGSLFQSVKENKRNSLLLVQEIVMFQINQLNLQNNENIKSSQQQNKNIQFSSVFQDKEQQQRYNNKERDQINDFEFQDIIQELNIFRKFVKIKIDQSLLGLKISNNKEAMLQVLKSFLSSVIALNYINSRKTKENNKSKVKQFQESNETYDNQPLKVQEQSLNDLQNQRISKNNSTSSLTNYIQSILQKSKEVSFTPNLKGSSVKKNKQQYQFQFLCIQYKQNQNQLSQFKFKRRKRRKQNTFIFTKYKSFVEQQLQRKRKSYLLRIKRLFRIRYCFNQYNLRLSIKPIREQYLQFQEV